ncbi:hypothetical protein [Bosea sp. 124]|uniref:hypothetical protein n=1 Tax=Bosea sp. 124 TaxID=2135642 RepID=UPI000D398F38|nr:hypothetical protein [Bosea sp. 124]PTM41545.1 hypothetical protein C8D03_3100 [Bosea sp. 124]
MPQTVASDEALDQEGFDTKPSPGRFRPFGGFLKLIVAADSSSSLLSRVRAGATLLALLAAFAGAGYFLPAYFSQYF